MPKSSRKTMRTGRSSSPSDSGRSSRSSSSRRTGRRATTRAPDVFPPKPRVGHPNRTPKPELRAKLLAPALARIGTHIANISEVIPQSHYLVMAVNKKNQPVAYCLKATAVSGSRATFYMRDSRTAGHTLSAGTLAASPLHIYAITPELIANLEAEGMWFVENEYDY